MTALDSTSPGASAAQKPSSAMDKTQLKAKWVLEIERYERKSAKFRRIGKKIDERYKAERRDDENTRGAVQYNVLWSNLQTLRPALYAKDPTPEVERRFKDKDPVGRAAADVLQRCLTYSMQESCFSETMKQVVLDRLLPGRGVAWVRYVPHIVAKAKPAADDENAKGGNDQPAAQPVVGTSPDVDDRALEVTSDVPEDAEVVWEEVIPDFVPWTDVGHTVARVWAEVDAVWRIAYMDRQELIKRFGKKLAAQIPLDEKPEDVEKTATGIDSIGKARIYEIWDKRTKRAIWLHRGMPEVLDVRDDPLKLSGFWPCPQFLQATVTSSSVIPTADYFMWSDQAAELDKLTARIAMLTKAIKVIGVYDASVPALARLLNDGVENRLIAVDSWAAFAEKGGMRGAFELVDIKALAEVLMLLYEARDKVKQDLYEISGLSDLLRGASDPEETAAAQKIKAGFASVRLKDMQRDVQRFARDLIRISGEVICNHFSLDTLKAMSGVQLLTLQERAAIQQQMQLVQQYQQQAQQVMQQHQQAMQAAQGPAPGQPPQPAPPGAAPPGPPQQPAAPPFDPTTVLGPPPQQPDPARLKLLKEPNWEDVHTLLTDNVHRNFRIDIETDSTIAQDEHEEQEQRMAFAKTVGELVEGSMTIVQQVPALAPAMAETIMFVLRSFRVGRPTESAFQEAMDKLAEMADKPPQPVPGKGEASGKDMVQVETIKQAGENQRAATTGSNDIQKLTMQHALEVQTMREKFGLQRDLEMETIASRERMEKYRADQEHARELQKMSRDMQHQTNVLTMKGAQHDAELNQQAELAAAAPKAA